MEAIVGNKIAPGLLGYKGQQTNEPVESDRRDNLWVPVDDEHDHGAHGSFDTRARNFSPQLWTNLHRSWITLGLVSLGAALVGVLVRKQKMNGETSVREILGFDYEMHETGCCGMAGAFGFEAEHYDVSINCGERVLLPVARGAAKDTLLMIADVFSCREQVRQTTDRVPLHLVEVIQMGLREGAQGVPGNHPEKNYITPKPRDASCGASVGAVILKALLQKKNHEPLHRTSAPTGIPPRSS